MKRAFVVFTIFLGLLCSLHSAVLWNDPLEICNYPNIELTNKGLATSDGCKVICWNEGTGDNRRGHIQKYNAQMQPVWAEPATISTVWYSGNFAETSDGSIIFVWTYNYLRAVKLNSNGEHVWNSEGVNTNCNLGTSSYSPVIKVKADNNGGAYILIGVREEDRVRLQHLNQDGTTSLPIGGYEFNPDYWTDYNSPDMIVLNDNNVIISYCADSFTVVKKVTPTAQTLWTEIIGQPAPEYNWVHTMLLPISNDAFYILSGSPNRIATHKYSVNGNPLWQEQVILTDSVRVACYENYSLPMQIVNQDSSLTLCWFPEFTSGLYAQRISPEGVKLWGETSLYIADINEFDLYNFLLSRDEEGGNYLCYSVEGGYHVVDTSVQHLTSTGAIWPQRLEVGSVDFSITQWFHCFAVPSGDNLEIIWQENRSPQCGIYAQKVNTQGEMLFAETGLEVRTGGWGYLKKHAMAPMGDRIFVTWCKSESVYNDGRIYCQIVNQDGSEVFPNGGVQIIDYDIDQINRLQAIDTPDGYVLILWSESNPTSIKAQLFDPSLTQVWEPGGRIITTSGGSCLASYDNSAFYIIWNTDVGIYGQKYNYSTALWGQNGIQLVSEVPGHANGIQYIGSLNGRYITWTMYENNYARLVYTLLFDENGLPCMGFNSYGNEIAAVPGGYTGQYFSGALQQNNDLIITVTNWWTDPYGEYWGEDTRLQKIGSDGTLYCSAEGIEWNFTNSNTYVCNGSLFRTYTLGSNLYLYKYNNDVIQDWEHYIHLPNSPSLSNVMLSETSADRLLIIAKAVENNQSKLIHLYYNITQEAFSPSEDIYFDNGINSVLNCKACNNTALLWVSGSYYYQSNTIRLQLINNGDVGNNDDTNAPQTLTLNHCKPNPFSKETNIAYRITRTGEVKLKVYNTKGQLIKQIVNDNQKEGSYLVQWDGTDSHNSKVASGVYFYRLETIEGAQTRKCLLLK